VDPKLSSAQAHGLYYSKKVYERLVGIKKVVDPGDLFHNPQAVGLRRFCFCFRLVVSYRQMTRRAARRAIYHRILRSASSCRDIAVPEA